MASKNLMSFVDIEGCERLTVDTLAGGTLSLALENKRISALRLSFPSGPTHRL